MKLNRLSALVILASTSLLTTPALLADTVRTLRAEMPAEGHLTIENIAGTLKVVPGSGDTIVAIATVHAENNALADAIRFETIERESTLRLVYPVGSGDTIRYPGDSADTSFLGRLFGTNTSSTTKYAGRKIRVSSSSGTLMYADVEIQVPARGARIDFRNIAGRMSGEDLNGDYRFDIQSGEILLTRVEGSISADTGSGDVKAIDIRGSFDADTGSGDIDLDRFTGEKISCDTGSGDIRVVRADVVEFAADTGSGEVLFETAGSRLEKVVADTGSGDVTLRLGPDASFEAVADVASGDFRNRYADAEPIVRDDEVVGYRRGDARIRVRVDTGSGDVRLEPGR